MDHLQAIVDHLLDYVEAFLNLRHYANTDKELFIKQHSVIIQSLKDQNENRLVETLKENIMVGLELVRKEMARFPRNEE